MSEDERQRSEEGKTEVRGQRTDVRGSFMKILVIGGSSFIGTYLER